MWAVHVLRIDRDHALELARRLVEQSLAEIEVAEVVVRLDVHLVALQRRPVVHQRLLEIAGALVVQRQLEIVGAVGARGRDGFEARPGREVSSDVAGRVGPRRCRRFRRARGLLRGRRRCNRWCRLSRLAPKQLRGPPARLGGAARAAGDRSVRRRRTHRRRRRRCDRSRSTAAQSRLAPAVTGRPRAPSHARASHRPRGPRTATPGIQTATSVPRITTPDSATDGERRATQRARATRGLLRLVAECRQHGVRVSGAPGGAARAGARPRRNASWIRLTDDRSS